MFFFTFHCLTTEIGTWLNCRQITEKGTLLSQIELLRNFLFPEKLNLRSTDNNILIYDPISQNSPFWLSVAVCELQHVWISFGPFVKQTPQQYRRQEAKH